MTEQEADIEFQRHLKLHNAEKCPGCQKPIDRGDVAWNNGSTEAGTGYTMVEIQCLNCSREIAHFNSWHWGADSFEDLVENVIDDWEVPFW